jgi:outer membrane protein assembly factor BamB
MNDKPELLYAGVRRTITALDRRSGRQVWRMKLPFWGGAIGMLVPHGDHLYASRRRSVCCLNRHTGQLLWKEGIGDSGFVLLSIPGTDAGQQQIASAHAYRAAHQQSADGGDPPADAD